MEQLKEGEIALFVSPKNNDKFPEWFRTAGVSHDREVFLPAALAGDEKAIFLAAGWDGNVPIFMSKWHLYVPVEWLKKEYPEVSEDVDSVKKNLLANFDNHAAEVEPTK